MQRILTKLILLISAVVLFGCSLNSEAIRSQNVSTGPLEIKLECKAANRLGCRHQGQIYPWNAWVEMKGYNSKRFAVKDLIQTGNTAVVVVIER